MKLNEILNLEKFCKHCNFNKPIIEFGVPRKTGYIDPICKECSRKRNRLSDRKRAEKLGKDGYTKYNRAFRYKRKYGLTIEQVMEMLNSQMGMCANLTCGKEIKIFPNKAADMANVDHCHTSGKVRGILCIKCNTVLGHIENKKMILGLTEYLKKFD